MSSLWAWAALVRWVSTLSAGQAGDALARAWLARSTTCRSGVVAGISTTFRSAVSAGTDGAVVVGAPGANVGSGELAGPGADPGPPPVVVVVEVVVVDEPPFPAPAWPDGGTSAVPVPGGLS